ncbi:hypothetical protein BGZ58_009796 [Dissophora ornata]|nr:hypothetical protein BGZ58_009796 [Dissophora ornata]
MDSPVEQAPLPQQQREEHNQEQQSLVPSAIPLSYSTLLPPTSFSYRQISPDILLPMPTQRLLPVSALTASPGVAASPSTQAMDVWVQQIQQLHQLHHYQQHQLLSSTLLGNTQEGTGTLQEAPAATCRTRSFERSASPSSATSPSEAGKNSAAFQSPSAEDDEAMDSDSDDQLNGESCSQKPSTGSPEKKMTSKERKKLRNKLSARNFRVRRKEYITTLEDQIKEAHRETTNVQRRLIQSELNCQLLRQQLETTQLSQSLLATLRASMENANTLACLLNPSTPSTESFPGIGATAAVVSSTNNAGNSIIASAAQSMSQIQQLTASPSTQPVGSDISNSDGSLLPASAQESDLSTPTPSNMASASSQPFVFYDDWELDINRAEIPECIVSFKDESFKRDACHTLLDQYEAEKLVANTEKKLAQTYNVIPNDGLQVAVSGRSIEEALLQTVVYMLMAHMMTSLFEFARSLQVKTEDPGGQENTSGKSSDWRESRIRKFLLSKHDPRSASQKANKTEAAREMGVDVAVKTSDLHKMNYFAYHYNRMRMKLQETFEKERPQDLAEYKEKQCACTNRVKTLLRSTA